MDDQPKPRSGILRATLREVSPGLYSAEYAGEANAQEGGAATLPDAHLSTSPEGVKTWVEQMAQGLGYDRVIWEQPQQS